MNKRNNGTAEYEILQNRFTSFICTSMRNARINYLKKESVRANHTYEMEDEKFALMVFVKMQHQHLVFLLLKKILYFLQKTDIFLCLYGYTGKNCDKFKEEQL